MKRILLLLLTVVIVAGVIGTLAAKDPGYVLISYDGATFQTGLWVFLAIVVGLVFTVWLASRVWRLVFGSAARIQAWRKDRKLGKSIEHTSRGLLYLQEGNVERAIKFLTSGAKHQPQPAISFLYLARAFDANGDSQGREKYFRLALEADKNVASAVALAKSELAYQRGDYDDAIGFLEDAPNTHKTLLLRKRLLLALEKWDQLQQLMPKLKKVLSQKQIDSLEKTMVLAGLSEVGVSNDRLLGWYRSAGEVTKSDAEVLLKLCSTATAEKELEVIVRKSINADWNPQLVEAYGGLGKDTLQKRLKVAQGWQKSHPLDASLSYSIGSMQEQMGNKAEAQNAYRSAVEQGKHRLASRQLANLHAFDGEHQKSNELLNVAYRD